MPAAGINPIPDCQLTWVFGLLETLDDRGGRDDGYKIVREQLKKLGLFAYFMRLLRAQEDRSVQKELVLEHLAMLLPNEAPEKVFSTIVNWGRFAELFGYNKDEDRFYLDQE